MRPCMPVYAFSLRSNGLKRTSDGHSHLASGVITGGSAVRPSLGIGLDENGPALACKLFLATLWRGR